MKKFLYLLYFSLFISINIQASDFNLQTTRKELQKLIQKESEITLSVANAKPDRRITRLMENVNEIGQNLMSQEVQNDEIISLSEKCLAILTVLRERRIYAYMLWAEGCLEKASTGRNENLNNLSQPELVALYAYLGNINISVINENMLNREIVSRLAAIYDCLDRTNKPKVRIMAILQQRDQLSVNASRIPMRKSLDDF